MKNIVIFASGSGSNALNLIQKFNNNGPITVKAVFTNKKNAGVISKAIENKVAVQYFDRSDFYDSDRVIEWVKLYQADLIVLAGFLWLIPESFINHFENKIINLHPSLLPKFGGKGMYGTKVHQAVLEAKESITGITIHHVNKDYDKGEIIWQEQFEISEQDTLESVEQKIHDLEFEFLPKAILKTLKCKDLA